MAPELRAAPVCAHHGGALGVPGDAWKHLLCLGGGAGTRNELIQVGGWDSSNIFSLRARIQVCGKS